MFVLSSIAFGTFQNMFKEDVNSPGMAAKPVPATASQPAAPLPMGRSFDYNWILRKTGKGQSSPYS